MDKKIYAVFYYILAGLLALGIGVYFRLYPLFSFTSNESSEKATLLVLAQVRSTISRQVQEEFPQLSELEQRRLIKQKMDQALKEGGPQAAKTIERVSNLIEAQSPEDRKIYLLEADPFYYYTLTENIAATGRIAETTRGSKYFNPLMLAPEGHWEPRTFHPHIGYFVYRVLRTFRPDIPLMEAVAWTPVLLTALALAAFWSLAAFLRCGVIVSFTGAVFFLLAPIFVKRSSFGWYDNDPYNILFPLLILLSLFTGLKNISSAKKSLPWAILTGLLITLYAFFWQGWVYLPAILACSGTAGSLYAFGVFRNRSLGKALGYYFAAVLLMVFAGIGVSFGWREFSILFQEGLMALKNFMTPQFSLWPDLFISVGELRRASWLEIIRLTGGAIFCLISLGGLIAAWRDTLRNREHFETVVTLTLTVFLMSTIAITLGAQRFALLSLIPLSVFFLIGLNKLPAEILKICSSRFPIRHHAHIQFTISAIIVLIAIFPIQNARQSTRSLLNPIFNSTWDKALAHLRAHTPENSIINTWWPPGHFIKAIAHRRVTFDGATINQPQAYWLANVFLSNDEQEALGLLRMLNNSANQAANYLQSLGIPLSQTVTQLYAIAPLSRADAQAALTGLLSAEQAEHLLTLTHNEPPPSYLLIYSDFIDKILELSFVGKWNFKEVEALNEASADKRIPPRNSPEYIRFLWELAGGPLKVSETLSQLGKKENTLLFEQNVMVNIQEMSGRIASPKFGRGIPQSIFYADGDRFVEKKLTDATLNFSIVLLQHDDDRYSCILMDDRMARSLIVRLYYFKGVGLQHFKPFIQEKDLTGRTQIFVYEVNWNGNRI